MHWGTCRRVWLAITIAALPFTAATAAEPASAKAEREQIQRERAAVEARYHSGEKACRERFVVSSCMEDLQAKRREALASLREREITLDEAKRKADAAQNERRLQAKREAALNKPEPTPRADAAANGTVKSAASAPAPSERARRRSKTADDAAQAAARVAAQQRRTAEAEARREAAEKRNAERAASGKKSTPLPIPAPLPPASAASE